MPKNENWLKKSGEPDVFSNFFESLYCYKKGILISFSKFHEIKILIKNIMKNRYLLNFNKNLSLMVQKMFINLEKVNLLKIQ